MARSTTLARPSGSTTGVMRTIMLSRMSRMKGSSLTASRYTSSMSISGEPVSGEWMAPVAQ
jgi:hypothetical protein